jgi:hypothetical protein
MKRLLLTILLLTITCTQAFALSPGFLGMGGGGNNYQGTINGISSITSAGTRDTGTETITMRAGVISASASCNGLGAPATISLYTDSTLRDSHTCDGDFGSKTLTYTITGGSHTIRVEGTGAGSFSANTFRIPIP